MWVCDVVCDVGISCTMSKQEDVRREAHECYSKSFSIIRIGDPGSRQCGDGVGDGVGDGMGESVGDGVALHSAWETAWHSIVRGRQRGTP